MYYTNRARKFRQIQRGYSLLEQSITLVSLLTLLMGATDLYRYIHTYNILTEGASLVAREMAVGFGSGLGVEEDKRLASYTWNSYEWDALNQTVRTTELFGSSGPDETPSECKSSGVSKGCVRRVSNISEGEAARPSFNLNNALNSKGYNEFYSGLPGAKFDCAGIDCLNLKINFLPTQDERDSSFNPYAVETIEIEASYNLPLFILALNPVQIKVRVGETPEFLFSDPGMELGNRTICRQAKNPERCEAQRDRLRSHNLNNAN